MAHYKTHTHIQRQTDRQRVADRHKQSTTDTEHKTRINDNKQVEYEETEKQTGGRSRGYVVLPWARRKVAKGMQREPRGV